jgi:hypothetical protein
VVVLGPSSIASSGSPSSPARPHRCDAVGRLLGALDVSGSRGGHHGHTLGQMRSGARMIEHRLNDTRHPGGLTLRLHTQNL